jgi:hypothetical protein
MAHNEDNDPDDDDDDDDYDQHIPQQPLRCLPFMIAELSPFHLINMVNLMMVVQHT